MGSEARRWRELPEVDRVPYRNAFLIEDLLSSRMTFLAGEPKAGKSLFAVGMVRALLEGDPEFLGLKVFRKLDRVAWGYSDDGADEELRERFHDTPSIDGVILAPIHGFDEADWDGLPSELVQEGAGLFVLDTVLGSLGRDEDISSSLVASEVVRRVRPISEAGIPVLLVTHTPKGNAEGLSVASSVIGGRALAGGARGVIVLRKPKGGRKIETAINRAREDLEIPVKVSRVSEGADVPLWERVHKSTQERKPETYDKAERVMEAIVSDQPQTTIRSELARLYGPTVGWSEQTARKKIADLMKSGALAHLDGTWTAEHLS